MFCSHCGSQQAETSAFCSSCGGALHTAPAPVAPVSPVAPVAPVPTADFPHQSPNTVAPKNVSTWKRVIVTAVIVGVILSLWNFVIRPALSGAGGVTLDSALVEQNIKAEYTKNGYDVKVECPHPMGGNVGDKRNCLVTNNVDGSKVMAVVTIENAQGAITWVAE